MNQTLILYPLFVMVGLTVGITIWMGKVRFTAVKNREVRAKYFKLYRGDDLPDHVARVGQHYTNLMELPILFYTAIILIYVQNQTDLIYLALAWGFVLTRFIHSYIHTTYNHVGHRFNAFALGFFILMALWLKLLFHAVVS